MPIDPLGYDPRQFPGTRITKLTDEHGNIIIDGDNDGDITGDALTEFIEYGVWNGSFSIGPYEGIGVEIDSSSETRRVPYWAGPVQVSGQSIYMTWEADASSPSGYVLRFHVPAGAAGDEAYIEQIIPIGGTRSRAGGDNFRTTMHRVVATSDAFQVTFAAQYLDASGAPVGSEQTGTWLFSSDDEVGFKPLLLNSASPAATARSVRFRVGVKRNSAAASDTATIDICDVRRDPARAGYQMWADVVDPATYPPGYQYQADGMVVIYGSGSTAGLAIGSDKVAVLSAHLELPEGATPATPPSGGHTIYAVSGGDRALQSLTSDGAKHSVDGLGQLPFAFPIGIGADAVSTGAVNLIAETAGSAGAVAIPIALAATMTLYQLRLWSTDTAASLRTASWGLYIDRNDGTNTLRRIAVGNGFSYTPGGAAAARANGPTTNPVLIPGLYWLVIRNTSASVVFGIGVVARGTLSAGTLCRTNNATGIGALGSTIDISSWSSAGAQVLVRLEGQIGAEGAVF